MFAAEVSPASPVADYRDQVALLCQKFTRATGWTVRFVAGSHEAETEGPHRRGASRLDALGRIELLLPARIDHDTKRRAQSATGLLVEMIEQLAASWQDRNQRGGNLKRLVEVGRTLTASSDGPEAVPVLLRAAVELTCTQSASFHLLDRDLRTLVLRGQAKADSETNIDDSLERQLHAAPVDLRALVEGPSIVENWTGLNDDHCNWLPTETACAVCVPVIGSDGPLGTLWVSTTKLGIVGTEQVDLLQAVATQLAALLDRVAVRDEQAIRERVLSELQELSECNSGEQLGILPPGTGFDAVGRCRSMYEVGGDLCELVPLSEGRTLVAVGDACGHSVQAAFVMTAVRSAMSAVLDDRETDSISPTEVVARINRALCRVTMGHQFMSCLVGVIDSRRMNFVYSNAGHPVPILVRSGECRSLESHGMPLGILSDAEYTSGEVALRGQDVLVLFSDGVLETMNERRELFRPEGVIATIENGTAGEPIDGMMDRIWDASEEHGDGTIEDDKTLLLLRMEQRPVARPHHQGRSDHSRRQAAAVTDAQFSL